MIDTRGVVGVNDVHTFLLCPHNLGVIVKRLYFCLKWYILFRVKDPLKTGFVLMGAFDLYFL